MTPRNRLRINPLSWASERAVTILAMIGFDQEGIRDGRIRQPERGAYRIARLMAYRCASAAVSRAR